MPIPQTCFPRQPLRTLTKLDSFKEFSRNSFEGSTNNASGNSSRDKFWTFSKKSSNILLQKSPSEDVSGSSFLDTSRSYLEIFFQKLLNFLQTISNNNSCGNLSSRFFEDFFRTFTEDCLVCFCSNSSRHFSKQWVTVKISPEIQL